MNGTLNLQIIFIVFLYIAKIDGTCTLPALLDGNWWDSRTATVAITQSTGAISGWSFTAYSVTRSAFTCVESDSSYWLFKADDRVQAFGPYYFGYFCVRYTKITDYSYYYYLDSNTEAEAANLRITMIEETASASATISSTCSPTSGPSTEEFHVLVKENQQANVKQWFPDALLGVYEYSVTDSSTTTCGTGSVWDGCTNRTTVNFNYTQCSTTMFDSTTGELYATYYVTSGSTNYVILLNGDSSTSTRFTCLAVSGTDVSSNPGSCEAGQTATSRTSDANSVTISLTAYETCPFTTSPDESPTTSNAGIIAGVVVLLIIVIAVVIVGIFYYKYKTKRFPWQKSKVENGSEENAEKPPPPGMVVEPISPRMAVDVHIAEEKKHALPPLSKPAPHIDVNKNKPLPSITRQ